MGTTNGSVLDCTTTGVLRLEGLEEDWEKFCCDPTPQWQRMPTDFANYHKMKLASGKHKHCAFTDVYKDRSYVDWLLRGEEEGDPSRGKTSRGMRMFYEYCKARRNAECGPCTRKRPAAARSSAALTVGDQIEARFEDTDMSYYPGSI